MADLIDFITKESNNKDLGKEFLSKIEKIDPKGLSAWFKEKGYEVSLEECTKVVDNKENYLHLLDVSLKSNY